VPITFALKLPQLTRQEGIPELRQGVVPPYPTEGQAASVSAQVTLDPDGHVAEIEVVKGVRPWTDALLQALKTWRFAPEGGNAVLSFRVDADFVPARKDSPARVDLRASGPQRSESFASAPEAAKPPTTAASPAAAAPPAAAPEPSPAPAAAPTPATATPPAPAPPAPASAAPASTQPVAGAPGGSAPSPAPGQLPAPVPPPVEVINVPPREAAPAPALPEAGASAIRDVTLSAGVPDLTRGRRPVAPPLARISGTSGAVQVRFAVDAAGVTAVQAVEGPELLKPAAQQVVASWVFRRLSAQRLYLVATFTYAGDTASATVRPQDAPDSGPKTEAAAKPQ
jgi:outer membrane biosynthesis protein TonB